MPLLIVVRRNAAGRFQQLQELYVRRSVEVIWDRRLGERRQQRDPTGVERRVRERRDTESDPPPLPEEERRAERRRRRAWRMPERRRSDRRRPPPVTWTALDFLIVRPRE